MRPVSVSGTTARDLGMCKRRMATRSELQPCCKGLDSGLQGTIPSLLRYLHVRIKVLFLD
jgi:hypothetical protein